MYRFGLYLDVSHVKIGLHKTALIDILGVQQELALAPFCRESRLKNYIVTDSPPREL